MKPIDSIIEKEDNNRIMSHKAKPLCSCFVGDKMVDMYARFNFDLKTADWSKAYVGHSHNNYFENFIENIGVYDGDDEEINKTVDAVEEYFRFHQLYLH